MSDRLEWVNALSTRASLEAAVTEITHSIKQVFSGKPDLGILFISSAYASEYPRIIPLLIEQLPIEVIVGCGGAGIIGMQEPGCPVEIEGNTAISLSVAKLPKVGVHPFYIRPQDLPDLDSSPQTWSDLVGVAPELKPAFIILSEPFYGRVNDLLEGLDFAYPGSVKIGGLASGASLTVASGLFYYSSNQPDSGFYREGTVGVALSGNIVVETIVAQGCRPIGKPYQIAQGERNIVLALVDADLDKQNNSTRSPLDILREIVQDLSDRDRLLAQNSIFIGIARDEFKLNLEHGDFLIRNLLGVDPNIGAIAIGDSVRPGQRIQFHLRDARTSAEDLEILLQKYQQQNKVNSPVGALMFSCLGRGEGLYGQSNFDSELFLRYLDNIEIGGFFCNGEIGPVGDTTFVHGYTSAFGILSQPE
jgi:small ligand-binding sensory domain FIST